MVPLWLGGWVEFQPIGCLQPSGCLLVAVKVISHFEEQLVKTLGKLSY